MILPDPNTTPFDLWVGELVKLYPNVNIPKTQKVEGWHNFADALRNNKAFNLAPIPSKIVYPTVESWKKWASELNNSLF